MPWADHPCHQHLYHRESMHCVGRKQGLVTAERTAQSVSFSSFSLLSSLFPPSLILFPYYPRGSLQIGVPSFMSPPPVFSIFTLARDLGILEQNEHGKRGQPKTWSYLSSMIPSSFACTWGCPGSTRNSSSRKEARRAGSDCILVRL